MKIDKEELYKLYMEWVDQVTEECDWKTHFDSEELMIDEEFGLTEIAHRLDILPAPDYIVEEFMKDID